MKIILPITIELKGSCKGITTTQVERTETNALYKRSDDVWECFKIRVTAVNVFVNGSWVNTYDLIERYPHDELFGLSAWSGRETTIRAIYNQLNADSDSSILPNVNE